MSRMIGLLVCTLLMLTGCSREPASLPPATLATAAGLTLPVLLEDHRDQGDRRARFVVRSFDHTVFLGVGEMTMVVAPPPREPGVVGPFADSVAASTQPGAGQEATAIRMTLVGASASEPRGETPDPAVIRHVRGNGPEGPQETVRSAFRAVRYEQVYPQIDLVFHGGYTKLNYEFQVAPGADPGRIRLRFAGAEPQLDADGNLVLETPIGRVIHTAPEAYQRVDGQRTPVRARFVLTEGDVGVEVSGRDPDLPLVIDPVIVFATYLGGAGTEFLPYAGVATNGAGFVYVVGATNSFVFPGTTEALLGYCDAFVARYNLTSPQSPQVEWITLLGGERRDVATGVAVGGDYVYVSGTTTSDEFPTTSGSYLPDAGIGWAQRGYVAQLETTGVVARATYLGSGSGPDLRMEDVAVVPESEGYGAGVYVAGTASGNGYGTQGAFQQTSSGWFDAVVARISLDLASLDYLTYLGGTSADFGRSIAVQSGIAYVAGTTNSILDFPVSPGAAQEEPGLNASFCLPGDESPPDNCWDGFVAAIGPTGGTRIYATYLGGPGADGLRGIAVDAQGQATVVGRRGGSVPWVDRLDPNGALVPGFGTVLDATGEARGVALDAAGSAQVTGWTSTSGLATPGAVQPEMGVGPDAFFATVDPAGSLSYFTYLGGGRDDYGHDVAVDGNGTYIVGHTMSEDFPTVRATQPTLGGDYDALLVWLADVPIVDMEKTASVDPATLGQLFDFNVNVKSTSAGFAVVDSLTDHAVMRFKIQEVDPPTPSASCTIAGNGTFVLCTNLGFLGPSAVWDFGITAEPTEAGLACNVARLWLAGAAEPVEAAKCIWVEAPAEQVILEVIKTGSTSVPVDYPLGYEVIVRNIGPATATDVQFEDRASPSGLIRFLDVVSPGVACSIQGEEVVECSLGDLGPGEGLRIGIRGRSGFETGQAINLAVAWFGTPTVTVSDTETTVITPPE